MIPEDLFDLARQFIRSRTSFEPEHIRHGLVYGAKEAMQSLSAIERNHPIIAERVMRAVVRELAAAGEIEQLKRGVWMKASVLATANAQVVSEG